MSKNVKIVSFARSPAYVYHRAMMNRRDNNIVDALELMRRAVEGSPENREYRLDLAELYCELGCHAQSCRLLLDILAEGNGPSECYYGLALNQLGMNDLPGARRSLRSYRKQDPNGAHLDEVQQLSAELDFYNEISHPKNRRLLRAMLLADRACEAMKEDRPEKACRLFEQSLKLAKEQYEMQALYAMALFAQGKKEEARMQAAQAVVNAPSSVRVLCVCAQVMYLLDEKDRAQALLNQAAAKRPEGQELRMMIYAMGELQMHEQVAEYVRLALHETPYDRDLLHIRAIALYQIGISQVYLKRLWERILRIDPQDSVAQFYKETALAGKLSEYTLDYNYQVPREEYVRRLKELTELLSNGFDQVKNLWVKNSSFQQLLMWAVHTEDGSLSRAAVTTLTTIDSKETRSLLRGLLFSGGMSIELKLYAALSLRLQGIPMNSLLPEDTDLSDGILQESEVMLTRLSVGERQLLRFTDEVLQREYNITVLPKLLLIWTAYRRTRSTTTDPLESVEGASAALAYNYLVLYDKKPNLSRLARAFKCSTRQLLYYSRCMAVCLNRIST